MYSIRLSSKKRSSLVDAAGVLVQEPGKTGDGAVVVSGGMAGVFQEGFGIPHVGSVGGVSREHGGIEGAPHSRCSFYPG